jgi:hypothetical protein
MISLGVFVARAAFQVYFRIKARDSSIYHAAIVVCERLADKRPDGVSEVKREGISPLTVPMIVDIARDEGFRTFGEIYWANDLKFVAIKSAESSDA